MAVYVLNIFEAEKMTLKLIKYIVLEVQLTKYLNFGYVKTILCHLKLEMVLAIPTIKMPMPDV